MRTNYSSFVSFPSGVCNLDFVRQHQTRFLRLLFIFQTSTISSVESSAGTLVHEELTPSPRDQGLLETMGSCSNISVGYAPVLG